MHLASFAAIAVSVASAAQTPTQRYTPGQEVRLCGEVVERHTNTSTCEATLVVRSAGEDFDVLIPASVRKNLSVAPERLRGAVACFSGRIAIVSPRARVNAAAVDVTAAPPGASFASEAVVSCGGNVTMPRVISERKPQYTTTAMRERVQGSVEVEAVVDAAGTITEARVIRPLHPELDEEALKAVRAWRFAPGVMDGKPVPVLVDIEMTFALSSRK